jgi:hypothetical protein
MIAIAVAPKIRRRTRRRLNAGKESGVFIP